MRKHWNEVQKDQTTQLWSNLIKTDASGNIKVNLLHIRASPVWLLRLCCLVTCCVTAEFRVNKKAELRARRALFWFFFCLLSSEWLRLSQFVSDEAEQHRIHLFGFFFLMSGRNIHGRFSGCNTERIRSFHRSQLHLWGLFYSRGSETKSEVIYLPLLWVHRSHLLIKMWKTIPPLIWSPAFSAFWRTSQSSSLAGWMWQLSDLEKSQLFVYLFIFYSLTWTWKS